MKLHLNKSLRDALMACVCGVVAFTVAAPSMAVADITWVAPGDTSTSLSDGQGVQLTENKDYGTINMSSNNVIDVAENIVAEARLESNNGFTKTGLGTFVYNAPQSYRPDSVTVKEGTLKVDFTTYESGFVGGNAVVEADATLHLMTADALGYPGGYYNGNYTDTLTLKGTAAEGETPAQYAKLIIDKNQTLATNIVLKGTTRIEDGSGTGAGFFKTFGGTITANGDDNVINAKITSEAEDAKALTLNGTGSLTIAKLVNSKGLTVGVNTTVTEYSGSGALAVADNNSFTITDTTNLLAYSDTTQKNWDDSGAWSGANEVSYNGGNVWYLFTASAGEEGNNGQIVIGSADKYAVIGGNNSDFASGNLSGDRTILGNYLINGDLYFNRGGSETTSTVGSTGTLNVTGYAMFSNKQTWQVKDGGTLSVGKTIGLGHISNGAYWGRLLIDGLNSSVTAQGVKFYNNNGAAANYLQMDGGTLTLGADGVTTDGDKKASLILNGGTVKASAAWTAEADVSVTLGGVTFDSGANTITLNGATSFTDTVTNKGSLSLTGTLALDSLESLDVGTGTYSQEGDNGFFTGNYVLVEGDGTDASLTIGNSIIVGGDTDNPMTVTKDGNGGAYIVSTIAGTDYFVTTGETVYGAEATTGATMYILNGGQLSVGAGTTAALPLQVRKASTISLSSGSKLEGAISTEGDGGNLSIKGGADTGNKAYLNSNIDLGANSLIISEGYVRWGGADTDNANALASTTLTAGAIQISSGATLELYRQGGDMSATDVQLNGGTLHVQVIGTAGSGTLSFDTLDVTTNSQITGSWGGGLSFTSLTGAGNIGISNSDGNTVSVALGNTSAYTGTLTVGGKTVVTVNEGGFSGGVSISGGELKVAQANGSFSATSLSVSDGGVLTLLPTTLEQNVTLKDDGTISMGKTTLSGTVTLVGGSNLIKGNASDGTTLASTVTGTADSLTLTGANSSGYLKVTGSIAHTGNLVLDGLVELTSSASVADTVSSVTVNSGTAKVYGGGSDAANKKFANGITVQNGATLHFTNEANENITMKGGKVAIYYSNSLYGSITLAAADAATAEDEATPSENTIIAGASGNVLSALRANVGGEGNLTLGESDTPTLNLHSTISNSGDVTIAGTVDMKDSASIANTNGSVKVTSGSLIVNSGTSVTSPVKAINGTTTNATISEKTAGTAPTYTGVTVTNSGLTGGTLSDAKIDITGTFSIASAVEDSAINVTGSSAKLTLTTAATDTAVTVTGGGTLSLADVAFGGTSSVSVTGSTLDLSAVGQELGASLTLNGDILLDLSGLNYDYSTLAEGEAFTLLSNVSAFDGTNLGTVSIKFSEDDTQTAHSLAYQNNAVLVYMTAPVIAPPVGAIPEPATTTLSLLALSALAARRRRRA